MEYLACYQLGFQVLQEVGELPHGNSFMTNQELVLGAPRILQAHLKGVKRDEFQAKALFLLLVQGSSGEDVSCLRWHFCVFGWVAPGPLRAIARFH